MREKEALELYELQQIIREGVEDAIPEEVLVRAEIASIQQRGNGHCYLELCQSGPSGPVAKIRAVIWRSYAAAVLGKFAAATGAPLQSGVSVIFEVRVNYSELYGITLVISDVDVEHTLGEAELRRRETIERLEKEELIDLQKELALPDVPYRLAVISAEDAAGYGDFRRHLLENEYGFAFDVQLFPATMQGDTAPVSIVAALERIAEASGFDAALILRGGGSSLDLACFDDYNLCAAIARFPLPVFTAIGHDRDTHIADMVACEAVKTPTALADLFIDAVAQEDERIQDLAHRLRMGLLAAVSASEAALDKRLRILSLALSGKISGGEQKLSELQSRIFTFNPRKLLESGYTLVTDPTGRLLKSARGIKAGDALDVRFPDGTVNCTVNG
ncbi:MAG: exodeoxyribonuclease VII large subunit [Bacteroidales bacterium]|nr:exodeoxyribonuclease VII large subunit [Bacteroidales bacterium]